MRPVRNTPAPSRRRAAATAAVLLLVLQSAGTCDWAARLEEFAARATARPTLAGESHPFILLSTEQIAPLRARVTREPAKSWLGQLKRRIDDSDPTALDPGARLRLARDSALHYALTDNAADADRAAKLLANTPLLDDAVNTNDGLHTFVGRVPQYCEAYDLLKTTLPADTLTWQINPDDDAAIRKHIANMARWLRENRPFWYDVTRNNWAIRQYAALTLATMTIADGTSDASADEVRNWFEYARDEALRSLDAQVCPEGAFAEGCGYMNYAAENYLPMFFALRNLLNEDLFATPRYRDNFEWLTKLRMPSGHLPNFDDAPLGQFPTHYLTSAYTDAGLIEWDWQRAGSPTMDLCRALCWHDDRVAPAPPAIDPCMILPEAGNAILRSSWDADATYMLLLAEHGQSRTSGYGHEHPDNTSFLIEAFGEVLALDSGYIDFANHALVNKPESHNLILIDETGPPFLQVGNQPLIVDQDAFIANATIDGDVPRCTVRTNYANMEILRTILMPGRDHFVIVDNLRPISTATPRKFSWLLHGNAGVAEADRGTGGSFELGNNFARWTRPSGVALQLWLTSSAGPPAIRERFDTDGEHYRHQLTGHGPTSILRHRTAQGVINADDVVFLAVLVPARSSADLPRVHETSHDATLAFELEYPGKTRVETITISRNGPGRPRISISATNADGAVIYESTSD